MWQYVICIYHQDVLFGYFPVYIWAIHCKTNTVSITLVSLSLFLKKYNFIRKHQCTSLKYGRTEKQKLKFVC